MAKAATKSSETSDREIRITRVVNAPRERVWEAMTNPRQVSQWWGPNGFSTRIETMEVKPGGVWKHVMRGPDGTEYPNKSIFREVVHPERLVLSVSGGSKGRPGVSFDATWTFEDIGDGKTRVTIHSVFPTAENRDTVIKSYNAIEGGNQTLARLDGFLSSAVRPSASGLQVQPYVFFEGRCEEAIELYKRTLGAEVVMLMRYKESPDQASAPKGAGDKVMHALLRIGKTMLMMSDGSCSGSPDFKGFFLSLTTRSPEEAEERFAALSEGGKVSVPLCKTFFSPSFGMLHDRLGVGWMVVADSTGDHPDDTSSGSKQFSISRELSAPRDLVWKAWTEPERLLRWWGPVGWKLEILRHELRPGGVFHYRMTNSVKGEMWGRFVFKEVVVPGRLEYVSSFSDAQGGLMRAPFSPTFPREVHNVMTLIECDGKTRLELRATPIEASEAEMQTWLGMFTSMRGGFGGTFEQLIDYLRLEQA